MFQLFVFFELFIEFVQLTTYSDTRAQAQNFGHLPLGHAAVVTKGLGGYGTGEWIPLSDMKRFAIDLQDLTDYRRYLKRMQENKLLF